MEIQYRKEEMGLINEKLAAAQQKYSDQEANKRQKWLKAIH